MKLLRRACIAVVCASGAALAPAQEVPAIVALTLDSSGSIRPELIEQTRVLSNAVLEALPPGSEVAVFTFDDSARVILERTKDAEAVRAALGTVARAGRYTALYDAIYDAGRYLKVAPRARKAIILVTDGKDENSALSVTDGEKVAVDAGIPIFTVGIGRVQEAVLRRLAKLTGGEYAVIADAQGASIAAAVMAQPLPAPSLRPPTSPTAAPAAEPTVAGETASFPSLLIYASLGIAVIGAAGFIYFRRQTPAPTSVRTGSGAEATRSVPPAGLSLDLTGVSKSPPAAAEATIMMARSDASKGDRTVVLRTRPVLRVTAGPAAGQKLALGIDRPFSIGRAATNDLVIPESSISSEHCRVRAEEGAFVILDAKSTNGTFVNDRRVERQTLREGDVIRLGSSLITFASE